MNCLENSLCCQCICSMMHCVFLSTIYIALFLCENLNSISDCGIKFGYFCSYVATLPFSSFVTSKKILLLGCKTSAPSLLTMLAFKTSRGREKRTETDKQNPLLSLLFL